MREILCKGKSESTLEWVEGWYYKTYCKTGIQEKGHFKYINCLPDTIGQFTGIIDKNATKVFEGDIVDYKGEYGKIVYHDSEAMFVIEFDTWCTDFDHITGNEIEVVGNIHDNPELLEGGENDAE